MGKTKSQSLWPWEELSLLLLFLVAYECMGRTKWQSLWPWKKLSQLLRPFKRTGKEHRHNHFGACVVLHCTERRERTDSQSLWKELSHNLYGKDYVPVFMERTESQSLWKEICHNLCGKN